MQVVENCPCGVDLHFNDGCMGTHGDKDTANAMMEFLKGMNEERDSDRNKCGKTWQSRVLL
jgi:hypothetical protein